MLKQTVLEQLLRQKSNRRAVVLRNQKEGSHPFPPCHEKPSSVFMLHTAPVLYCIIAAKLEACSLIHCLFNANKTVQQSLSFDNTYNFAEIQTTSFSAHDFSCVFIFFLYLEGSKIKQTRFPTINTSDRHHRYRPHCCHLKYYDHIRQFIHFRGLFMCIFDLLYCFYFFLDISGQREIQKERERVSEGGREKSPLYARDLS